MAPREGLARNNSEVEVSVAVKRSGNRPLRPAEDSQTGDQGPAPGRTVTRRVVVAGLAGGAFAVALSACQSETPRSGGLTPIGTTPTAPPPSSTRAVVDARAVTTAAPTPEPLPISALFPTPLPTPTTPPPTPTRPAVPSTFVGAWPYPEPPTHFNVFAPGSLDLGIYRDLWRLPLAKYLWAANAYVSLLARSWGFQPPAAFAVTLQSGLTWSDGSPLTALDLQATLWCWRVVGHVLWNYVDSISVPDDHSLVLHLKTPSILVERLVLELNLAPRQDYLPFATRAEALFRAGKDLTSPEGKQLASDLAAFRPKSALGTGPYVIAPDAVTKTRLQLDKAPNGARADQVPFERVQIERGAVTTITPPVMAKLVDYVSLDLASTTLKDLQDERVRLQAAPTYAGSALGISYGNARVQSLLGDKRARQALTQALNGEEIGLAVTGVPGSGVRLFAGFGELSVSRWLTAGRISQLASYASNPPKASAAFSALGYTRSPDGVLAAPDGTRAELELLVPSDETSGLVASLVARQLAPIGFKVTARSVPPDQFESAVAAGSFQLALLPWGASEPHPYYSFVTDLFRYNLDEAVGSGGPGISFTLLQTTDAVGPVDLRAMVHDAATGLDLAHQKDTLDRLARAFNELLPIIPLYERWVRQPLLDGVRVTGWLPPNDPIYQNPPDADSFVVLQILNGTLRSV